MTRLRLATKRDGSRDGRLYVVAETDQGIVGLPAPVETMQQAVEQWEAVEPALRALHAGLPDGGELVALDEFLAPLPRAFQWAEGSTYLPHMERLRKARGKPLPPHHGELPAVYQSGSDQMLGPAAPIERGDPRWGLDIEATVAVIVDDVPRGIDAEHAASRIRLAVLANDLTHRHLLTAEYAVGVGFYQAKPPRPFAPFAVPIADLGDAWDNGVPSFTVRTWLNGKLLGAVDASRDAAFSFPELIAYMARTRPLVAGTLVGSGTVANHDPAAGYGCIAERWADEGRKQDPADPFLQLEDRIRIEAIDRSGRSVFGRMEQDIVDTREEN